MGRIKRFNLRKLMAMNEATVFFETGTWKGDGLAYAARYPFKKLVSSEIMPSIAETARTRFAGDQRVEIINDSSIDALHQKLSTLDGHCIFWLDAHFPGAEEGLKDYNEEKQEEIKLPLEKELELIAGRKNKFNDIILIDDLRIYVTGNFDSGNLPEGVLPPEVRTIQFAYDLFSDTHHIHQSFRDEGYLYLIPKKVKEINGVFALNQRLINKVFKKII